MQRMMWTGALLLVVACGGAPQTLEPKPSREQRGDATRDVRASSEAAVSPALAAAAPTSREEPSCDGRLVALDGARQATVAAAQACQFGVDCTILASATDCAPGCPSSVHVRAKETVRAQLSAVDDEHCDAIRAARCERTSPECAEDLVAVCRAGQCALVSAETELEDAAVPDANRAGQKEPPPRPDVGDAEERARRLLSAIVRDDASLAADFFFPQEAFRKVKAIPNPDRYWVRLFARFETDIHALHEALELDASTQVEFERLEIVRRGGFVRRGEEGNALPYWAARHNWLHFTRDGKPDKLEVRVLITWGDRWYITHLSEFR